MNSKLFFITSNLCAFVTSAIHMEGALELEADLERVVPDEPDKIEVLVCTQDADLSVQVSPEDDVYKTLAKGLQCRRKGQ